MIRVLLPLLFVMASLFSYSQPGKLGNVTISTEGSVVNTYSKITVDVPIGTSTITVNSIADLGSLSTGDLMMLYQAQGALIQTTDDNDYGAVSNYNGAGQYEYAYVASVSSNTITLACKTKHSYLVAAHSQVVKVPQYDNLTINSGASIVAKKWDGNTGGITTLHVKSILQNNGEISAAFAGFRGGKRDNVTTAPGTGVISLYRSPLMTDGGEKGESIAGYQSDYDAVGMGGRYGRGAPANGGGGGNAHNAAGGGGANGNNGKAWTGAGVMDPNPIYAAAWALDPDYISNGNQLTNSSGGGRGGYTYGANNADAFTTPLSNALWGGDYRDPVGGRGGRPLTADVESRIFFGGGGGAGDGNNNASNDGGDGGGIVYIVAPVLNGTGTISAQGMNGLNTIPSHNDAPGGGGGGGTIVIKSFVFTGQALNANGGSGGNHLLTSAESEGCGGGGGGGFIAVPTSGIGSCGISNSYTYIYGTNGLSSSSSVTEFRPNGGTWGAVGQNDVPVSPYFVPYTLTCIIDDDVDNVHDIGIDLDDDNDGIVDINESINGVDPSADADNDYAPNYADPSFVPYLDSNCDAINDYFDSDLDGQPDFIDLDSDNDGITDCLEAGGRDANGDGIIDNFIDIDANGLSDQLGAGLQLVDLDADGIYAFRDRDADGDGIYDIIEAGGIDTDTDGIVDAFADTDKDGYANTVDPTTNRVALSASNASGKSPLSVPDTDGDGRRNFEDIDSDNDGISDNVEGQSTAGYRSPIALDSDGDGIANIYDLTNGGIPITLSNTDGTDVPDYIDADSDNDGVADAIEGNDANSDGNASPTLPVVGDSDNDGLLDGYDLTVGSDNTVTGMNGSGSSSPLQDTDGDLIRDWRDTDDDGDCILTSSLGANGENTNSNTTWGDDFAQGGAPVPNYLFPTNNVVANGANRCGAGVITLSASSPGSGIFRWYDAAVGGNLLRTSGTASSDDFTTPSLSSSTTYYVQFDNGTCISKRKAVTATIINSSNVPSAVSASRCGSGSVSLSASTGSNGTFNWYDASTGGNLVKTTTNSGTSTFTTPSLSASKTYYVEFSNGSCTSGRASVTATINTPPVITTTSGSTCGNSTVTLSASAAIAGTFNWYTASTGGSLLSTSSGTTSSTYTPSAVTTTQTYYVEYNDGTCTSARTPVTASVSSALAAPSTTGNTICSAGSTSLKASYASSGTFRWYSAPSGGIAQQTDNGVTTSTFNTPSLASSTDYYVEYSNGTCTSPRAKVTAYVLSSAVTAISSSNCGTGSVTLGAESTVSGTFKWYSAASGGTLLSTSGSGVKASSYTTPSISSTTTYYVEFSSSSPACTAPRVAVTATIAPAVTVNVTNNTVCAPGKVTLGASTATSGTFRWYTASTGGTLLQTTSSATTSSYTTPYLSATTDYYVEFDQGTCVTSRTPVRAGIANTADIAVTDATGCGSGTRTLLAASGISGTFKWYTASSGGAAISTSGSGVNSHAFTTPSISSTTTYYVELVTASPVCTSERVPAVATVLPAASAPTAITGSRCGPGSVTIAASSSVAGTIRWYDASSGGTLLQTDYTTTLSTYKTPSIAVNTTYYAEFSNGSCTSSRTPVLAKVNTGIAPAPPTATGNSRCGEGTVTLNASSSTAGVFRWYTASSGGTLLLTSVNSTTSSYTTPAISASTTYYVEFDDGTCLSSSRTAVTATINPLPAAPTASAVERCGNGTVSLTATSSTAGTFRWYDASTGGTLLSTTASSSTSLYSPTVTSSTMYYVEFDNGSCSSASRTAVDVTVNTLPPAPTGTDGSVCGSGSVLLQASSTNIGTFRWYDASTGGTLMFTSSNANVSSFITPVISSTTNYYVEFDNGACTSSRTTVVASVLTSPNAPVVSAGSNCGKGTVSLSAVSSVSGTFRWYSASSGGSLLQADAATTTSTFITPSLSSTQTYYVEFYTGTCASTRVAVTATINATPSISSVSPGCSGIAGNGTISIAASIPSGSLEYSVDGSSFQNSVNFAGLGNGTYTVFVREKTTLCTTSQAGVVVLCNTPPVVSNKAISTNENTPISANVIAGGDNDPDGTTLTVNTTPLVGPSNGTLVLHPDGTYTYTPNANYSGTEIITFEVCDGGTPLPSACISRTLTITVNPVNDPPVATNDIGSTSEETPVTITVTTNDTDIDGTIDASTVDLDPATPGVHNTFTNASGDWSVNTAGDVTFTPASNFTGSASLDYTVNDNSGATSNIGTLTITVNPVNDAPVATNDIGSTNEDTPVTIQVTTNDTDSDGTIDASTVDLDPATPGVQNTFTNASGDWSVNTSGEVTFTPALNFTGAASLDYTVNDNIGTSSNTATLTITVNPVNDPPVATNDVGSTSEETPVTITVTTNDTDIDGTIDASTVDLDPATPGVQSAFTNASGDWSVNTSGDITFTPTSNFTGSASLDYTVNDNSGATSNIGTLTITVNPVNDAPLATNDIGSTTEDTPVTIQVTTNDTDSDGTIDASTVDLDPATPGVQNTFTNASGDWSVNTSGEVTFTPALNYNGIASLTYVVNDNTGATSNLANITVTVDPVNDPPVAVDDSNVTKEGIPVSGSVSLNDSDVDGTVVYNTTPVDGPAHGTIVITADGNYTYTPANGFVGTDIIKIQVCDNGTPSSCTTETLTIEVTPSLTVNPVAKNDSTTIFAGQDVNMNILNNDLKGSADINVSSVDLDPSEPGIQSVVTLPGKGTASVDATGVLHFEPEPEFTGTIEFNYSVSDVNGNVSNTASVTIKVQSNLPEGVIVPNAFSPNGDGVNDRFIIEGAESLDVALYVYNRWGNIVYSNSNYNNSWEGNTSNVQDPGNATKISLGTGDSKLPDGTYFYIVEFADQSKRYSGFVELRR
jgi:gliding motility-associated-like protein